jgi:hypothetical protein
MNKLRIKKWSDLDSWDPNEINYQPIKSGDINNKEVLKIMTVLEKYGLYVTSVGTGEYLKRNDIIIGNEVNYKEWRVTLGYKRELYDWLELEYNISKEDFNELNDKEKSDYELEWNDLEPTESDYDFSFSVFMGTEKTNLKNKGIYFGWKYLKLLEKSFGYDYILNHESPENDHFEDLTKGFKNFVNNYGIKINNDNFDVLLKINYRLYKDSKFLSLLWEICNEFEIKYKDLMEDLLKIN